MQDETIELVHDALLEIQSRMRRLHIANPDELSLLQSVMLYDLAVWPEGLVPSAIAKRHAMAPSNISRVFRSLEELGFIRFAEADRSDRTKPVCLTPAGQSALQRSIERANQICVAGLRGLDRGDLESIQTFFDRLASAFGVSPTERLQGQSDLVVHQTRLSQALGMVGPYLGLDVEISEFQVLQIVTNSPSKVTFAALANVAPVESSTLSRMLDRLDAAGFLRKEISASDARLRYYSTTAKGRARFKRLTRGAHARLAPCLAQLDVKTVHRFVKVIEKLRGVPFVPVLKPTFLIRRCATPVELRAARAFAVQEIVERKLHHNLRDSLLPTDSKVYVAITDDSDVIGVASSASPFENDEPFVLVRACREKPLAEEALLQALRN